MKLFLIRHPETEALKNRIIYGRSPSPLTPAGIASIGRTAKRLQSVDFAALFCSTQERAILLAEGIAEAHPGLAVRQDERLCEMSCGIYELKSVEEVAASKDQDAISFLREWGIHRPEGGENFEDVKARTGLFLKELEELYGKEGYGERPVAVVSHAMAMRAMISHLLDLSLQEIWQLHIQTAGILEIDYDEKYRFGRLISLSGPDSAI